MWANTFLVLGGGTVREEERRGCAPVLTRKGLMGGVMSLLLTFTVIIFMLIVITRVCGAVILQAWGWRQWVLQQRGKKSRHCVTSACCTATASTNTVAGAVIMVITSRRVL